MKAYAKRNKRQTSCYKDSSDKKNPFLEMIIQGLEDLKQENWEHYLKQQIDFTPKNLFSKLPYHRFNRFTLMLDMMIGSFSSPYYATFNQINQAGGVLKKGAKSRVLQYFNYVIKHRITGDRISLDAYNALTATQQTQYSLNSFIKHFRVFNAELIENMKDINIDSKVIEDDLCDLGEVKLCEDAESFISNLKNRKGLNLNHAKQNTASYNILNDTITMPLIQLFKDDTKYYSTLFHELIHWTGHESRLKRLNSYKTEQYALEELVAEMGAMLIYFDYNFKEEFVNSLVYLKGWLNHTAENCCRIETLENAFKASNKAVHFLYLN